LHSSKGIDVLINAFKAIKDEDIRLELYGPVSEGEPDSYLKEIIRLAEADPRINLRGSVTQEQIDKVYENIDVLVVPSLWYENAPLTVLESLRFGTPVICSDVEGITELITDGLNGLVFKRNNSEALRSSMLRLINEGSLIEQLRTGTRGIKSVEENAEELLELYSTLASKSIRAIEK
jgi:glycosyltransferase involved in cell wall biosynthesis